MAALDACLRGGLPRGQLSEMAGPRSSGRTTLLLQLLAAATRRGEIAALVDTFDRWTSASASPPARSRPAAVDRAGQRPVIEGSGPRGRCRRTLDRALKALNLVLQAGGFAVVAIDLADVPLVALKRMPFTTWLRVQRTIEGSDTACVLLAPEPLARSAGGLTLALAGRGAVGGDADRSRRLAGST